MSIAATVGPRLPFLRRYARALAGSQAAGDAAVEALLATLVAAPGRLGPGDPRVATYRLFSEIWNAGSGAAAAAGPRPRGGADRRLDALAPLARQAFLLTAMEGFEPAQAATVLGVGEERLAALVEAAGRAIAAQTATRVLVIEDEPIVAMELETLLGALGHTVIGNARTHAEALRFAERERPGLVLADIHLADGSSGLGAVDDILRTVATPVIVVTAYPEFVLTGRRGEPTFLITKPFADDALRAVVGQALFFEAPPARSAGAAPARPAPL